MRYNAIEKHGLTRLARCTIVIRMLTDDIAVDYVDEFLNIGASTSFKYMKKFYF